MRKSLTPALLLTPFVLTACLFWRQDYGAAPVAAFERDSLPVGYVPDRQALFGDLHVHTQYSFDAFAFGTRATPDDAYRYAQGEPLTHPAGFTMQLDRPLDFQAVTDHAVYLGIVPAMGDPASSLGQHPLSRQLQQARTQEERLAAFHDIIAQMRKDFADLMDEATFLSAWQVTIEAAEYHNRPGKFTAFIGYEYSSAPNQQNLHRNVIFRGSRAPQRPFGANDSRNPEDLWHWMDQLRAFGIDSLAIPHNANASNGQMFSLASWAGDPLSDDGIRQRSRNEPIIELTQVKGTSETHPTLSPYDEWANFEIMDQRVASDLPSEPSGSYARDALLKGLRFSDQGRPNPFRFGFVGSSDTHVGAGAFREDDYWSKVGLVDDDPVKRGSAPDGVDDDGAPRYRQSVLSRWGASGLAGVWAESNTRESIFAALERKETFATSGPRIRLRFFAGAELPNDLLQRSELIRVAYRRGVPMGGSLSAADGAPRFLAWALRDPMNAPLQRLQIVKGWIDETGTPQERVFDVACSDGLVVDPLTQRCPDNGAWVNPDDCSISPDVGAAELKALWTDPGFRPDQEAVYYLRALENPTCRWSTWDAIRAGVTPRANLPVTIQDRAWSSPIWVSTQ